MKLATYLYQHTTSCGIVTDDGIINIPTATDYALHSVKEILIKGKSAFERLKSLPDSDVPRLDFDQIRLCAPIPRPGKLLALAGNYARHLEETRWQDKSLDRQAQCTNPWPFLMPSTAAVGCGATIPWPGYSDEIDHEIELAVVIGKPAYAVSPQQAPGCIAGYTIANDLSARSVSFRQGRTDRPRDAFFDWLMGKWADAFLPLGPWLVTADEIPDPHNLDLTLTVNGQVRQQANTDQMTFDVYRIVSFLSHLMTLEPGDVICTGTPHGVGLAENRFLRPGDVIDCTIANIGTLSNTLGPKPDTFYRAFIQ
ncbi:MAG TPA: FAA hydrolase family protein [Phycisphaerales bacterium]|nr:FAA hydrolase family protein [Phycisphaerales bacterium]